MKTNWKSFWDSYRYDGTISESSLFDQVGRTVDGKPVSFDDFAETIEFVARTLDLKPEDVLLEYCCGNGLVTFDLALRVRQVLAFDFTEHLIDAARRFRLRDNVRYWVRDALEPLPQFVRDAGPTKCLMSVGLAHFDPAGFDRVLTNLGAQLDPAPFLLIGIPDIEKQNAFYNTPERQLRLRRLEAQDDQINDGIGRWWHRREIEDVAAHHQLAARFFDDAGPSNHFRMAALLTPAGDDAP
jgi:SAM-dependent methyltransferase